MQAPYARIPAVPAAIGLVCGVACGAAALSGLWLWLAAACCAAAGIGLWLWRDARFYAAAPLAMAAGIALSISAEAAELDNPPLADARNSLAECIYAAPLDGDAAAFLATTLVADGRYMRRAVREDFRNSGMAHVLALSGFHVGVVALLMLWLTRPMVLCRRLRPWRPLPVLGAVWAFVFIGGMAPSLQRAALMFTLLLAARWSGRGYSSLNALAVAAIAIVLVRPAAATDVGFVLSFVSVGGIVLLMPVVNPFDESSHPLVRRAASVLSVPVCATLATAPVVAGVFGSLPLLFLPANVVLSLLFAPFYVLSLVLVALSAAGIAFAPLTATVQMLYGAMSHVARWCSSAVPVHMPQWAGVASYAALVALTLWYYIQKKRRPE